MRVFTITKKDKQQCFQLGVGKRDKTVAVSGHRPETIVGKEARIIVELRKAIEKAIEDGYTIFLSGMSRGVDLWAADIVIELRRYNKDLKLVCVIPFEGFEKNWSVEWIKHYRLIKKQADYVHTCSSFLSGNEYQIRTNG